MAHKPKFSRAEMIDAALIIVRKGGLTALTSRGIGSKLGISSRPIFTEFTNMDEVKAEVLLAARKLYNKYISKIFLASEPFKELGIKYFHFAKEEPKLFALLFMNKENARMTSDLLLATHSSYEAVLTHIGESCELPREKAIKLFQTMWIFTHGITCLQITGVAEFTDEEIKNRLEDVFRGTLNQIKN